LEPLMPAKPRQPQDNAPASNEAIAGRQTVPRKPKPEVTPPALAEVQLLPIESCCAVGGVGLSWWRAAVAAGHAPRPAVQLPRCTRWRASEVREFWSAFAAAGGRLHGLGER